MLIRHSRRFFALWLAMLLFCGAACAQAQPMNILLIGVDEAGANGNSRSDAMILVRVDPENADMRMVSFLRDLYVTIPGAGRDRLNAAYAYGGEELLKKTLYENFGITVDRTATVHFSLLAELVDQLGGIEMEITEKERRELNALLPGGEDAVEEAGWQHINGQQALCYSRIRKIDSDFQRTSRQQAVISAMLRRASEVSYWQLFGMALHTLPSVQTDLKLGDITALLPLVSRLDDMDMRSAHVPFDGTYQDETINGMMVLTPRLDLIREKLHAFLDGE